jgi:uncharacterized protein
MTQVIIKIINLYQKTVSCVFPSCCRFYPSCSQYSIEALNNYGLKQGLLLSFKRILKCHPFHSGGIDLI